MRKWTAYSLAALAVAGPALAPNAAWAQEGAIDAADSGDTAWLLAASALAMLVLPGVALFYGGRVRAKGFLSVIVQCAAIAALASLLWIVCGYTLAFGHARGGWLGAGNAWMLIDLGNVREGTAVPESAFALFQMVSAAFAALLMAGAWAGRARFGWVLGFCALWGLIVYAPVAHWVWGGGWLATRMGVVDFAGGIVIHTSAGVSALVASLLLGRRTGFPDEVTTPHAPGLAIAGTALLWVGALGIAGGQALAATDDAASAMINIHAAIAAAALVWLLIERFRAGKPSGTGFAMGAMAGLAAVAPAAGDISPGGAILFGALAAAICYPAAQLVRRRLGIDDSLGVFAINGIGGMVGSLMLAVFLTPTLGGTGYAEGAGPISQLAGQAVGVGVVAIWSAVASALIALGVSLVFPMRVSGDAERQGLDVTSHGERAWEFD